MSRQVREVLTTRTCGFPTSEPQELRVNLKHHDLPGVHGGMGNTAGKQCWQRFGLGIAAPALVVLCAACSVLMPAPQVPAPWIEAGLPPPAGAEATAVAVDAPLVPVPVPVLRRLPERPSLLPPPQVTSRVPEEASPRRPAIYLASDPMGSLPELPPPVVREFPPPSVAGGTVVRPAACLLYTSPRPRD